MSKTLKDRLDYLIALVSEFAATHHLSLQQAYLYLQQYKGLDFADEFYDVEHTLSFDQAVEDITMYCKRMGGSIAWFFITEQIFQSPAYILDEYKDEKNKVWTDELEFFDRQ